MTRELLRNIHALLFFAGFVCLEVGIAWQWSVTVASMVGGGVLMLLGSWPYLSGMQRKKG